MKKKLWLLIVTMVIGGCLYAKQDSLTVKGKLQGLGNDDKVLIVVFNGDNRGMPMSATVNPVNSTFTLKVPKQKLPVHARLVVIDDTKRGGQRIALLYPPLELIIYQSDLTIKGTNETRYRASVTGDKENNAYTNLRKSTEDDFAFQKKVSAKDVKNDSIQNIKLQTKAFEANKATAAKKLEFINQHPNLFLSMILLYQLTNYYTADDYEKAYNKLAATYKNTAIAKQIKSRIEYLQPTAVGKPAINFTRKDKDGNEVTLNNYKGKIVLIDFWGSWCGPCRASHPHLKELYTNYKDKGFEIIAIAQESGATLEESRKKWLTAIEKDSINWVHILNQEGIEKQDLVQDYRVGAFPTKILLDKDGKILLRVAASANSDLDKMLEKLLP